MKNDKQLNALLYTIEQYPKIGRTKLMKFVFLVDLFMYNNCRETLLEDWYKRLKNGPVPSFAFANTDSSNEFFQIVKEPCDPERIIYQFSPTRKADISGFSSGEIQLFDTIIRSLKSHKTEEISELTHRFNLWKKVGNNEMIPLEDLKLDDYEYDDLESFVYFTDAVADAKQLDNSQNVDSDESIPDDLVNLQLRTMCGEH
jgi:hypothetical protein